MTGGTAKWRLTSKVPSVSSEHGLSQHIILNPFIRSGKPCVRGTRIAVADVLDYLGGGMTIPELLDDIPDLTAEDIQVCLSFAADRERRLMVGTA
jgi:uncharacterized protein (DUF433 family)